MEKKRLFLVALLILIPQISAQATDDQLAQMYVPVIKFNSDELFYPVEADYHIRGSRLMHEGAIIEEYPTADSLVSYSGEGYYLDNKLGWFDEIAINYQQSKANMPPVVYYRISESQGYTAIQYWFFYAFNDGPLNEHEGDWETITVLINIQGIPEWAAYSQHEGGTRLAWVDVERADTHPIVYTARGSHANYFKSYEGRFGLQSDEVGGGGITITPEQISLRPLESQAWLSFGGQWGEAVGAASKVTGSSGPFGPSVGGHESSWNDPVGWVMSQPIKESNSFIIDWIVYNFALLSIIYIIIRFAIKILGLVKKAQNGELQVKTLLNSSFAIWLVLGIIGTGIVFAGIVSPWYGVNGYIESSEITTDGPVELMSIDGMNGLQLNTLQKGSGMSTVLAVMIPFGILLLAGVLFTVMDIIGASSGKKLGLKYIIGGISQAVVVILVIVAVSSISGILPSLQPMIGEGIPGEMETLISNVSSTPFGSSYQGPLGDYAMLDINWGLGLGAYLMLIGSILKIIAGAAMIASAPKVPITPLLNQQYAPVINIVQQAAPTSCPRCGIAPVPGEKFCHNCGTRVL